MAVVPTLPQANASTHSAELPVVLAVAKKQFLIESRSRVKFVVDLFGHLLGLAPMLLSAAAIAPGRRSAGLAAATGSGDAYTFIVLGYAAFIALGLGNNVFDSTGLPWALDDEQRVGTLERNYLAPARREVLALGTALYFVALYLFNIVVLLLVCAALFGMNLQLSAPRLLTASFVLLALVALGVGLGMVTTGLILVAKDSSFVILIVHRPLMLLSGSYFLVTAMPQPFQSLALLDPVTYAVDAFRAVLTGGATLLPLSIELAILTLATILALAAGAFVHHRSLRTLLETGNLGLF